MNTIELVKDKVEEHAITLVEHGMLIEQHEKQIKEIRAHGNETNSSILAMNENIKLINHQINQTLRETIENSSFLSQLKDTVAALKEDFITRKAEKDYIKKQRRSISDWLKIGYLSFSIVFLIVGFVLAMTGHVKPAMLIKNLIG